MAVNTQRHIHLALTLGGANEYSPTLKWATADRLEIPRPTLTIRESLQGDLRAHVLKRNGTPYLKKDYSYTLVVTADYGYTVAQRKAQLDEMVGKRVYLVDSIHPDDGESHTNYVKVVFFKDIGPLKVFDRVLNRHYVDIELIDATDGVVIVGTESRTLFSQTASKTVANTVTETTLLSTGVGSVIIPANYLTVGKVLRITMRGYNLVNSGDITIKAKVGTVTLCTITFTPNTASAEKEVFGQFFMTCRTVGAASGSLYSQGVYIQGGDSGAAEAATSNTTSGSSIDTTAEQTVDITATWSVANPGNSVTITNLLIEAL